LRRRTAGRVMVLAAILLAGLAAAAAAQQPVRPPVRAAVTDTTPADSAPRPAARRDTTLQRRGGRDTLGRDSTGSDSTQRELVSWAPGDSVFQALLQRSGYAITRYQGDTVTFFAGSRRIALGGSPGAVQQGDAVIVGDSIVFDDASGMITVRRGAGGPVVLRDPAQGEDIVANTIRYNIRTSQGTVTDIATSTAIQGGEEWYVSARRAAGAARPSGDTTSATRFFGHDGSITSCDLTEPHYHFEARNMKVVKGSIMVARPAILYIGEVPVLWLPFILQDMRSGRRSGILSPNMGVAELVRNSPDYQRSVERLGYYFAISDYFDASVWLDWHSGAREASRGPGLVRYNGQVSYNWLNRFVRGDLATSYESWRDGQRNLAFTWNHRQEFSQRTSFSANVNYAQSTRLQQRGAFNPAAALATIGSRANFQTKRGPFSVSVGGSRTQYTGQEKVDMTLPTLNVTSQPIGVGDWLTWTPSLNLSNTVNQNLPVVGELGFKFREGGGGFLRDTIKYDKRSTTISFGSPLRIFGFDWQNSVTAEDAESDGPVRATIFDPTNPSDSSVRVFASEFHSRINWTTSINLPSAFQGTWNLTPSVGIEDVNSGSGFLVRSYTSGGRWVRQPKRIRGSLSLSPTFFRQYGGVGPFGGFLHAVQTSLSYGFAPQARVSNEYLQAVGLNPSTYVGSNMQSAVTLGINTYIEAKVRDDRPAPGAARPRGTPAIDSAGGARVGAGGTGGDTIGGDSAAGRGAAGAARAAQPPGERKIKLLSLTFSPLSYDFVRADTLGTSRGWTTENFNYSAQSDLLPGFNVSTSYSLFNGPSSDTRSVFKPYRTGVNASFSVGRETNALALVGRLFGLEAPASTSGLEESMNARSDSVASLAARPPVAGERARMPVEQIERGQGWRATLSYSSNRTRPDLLGTVIQFDPASQCEQLRDIPAQYEQCVDYVRQHPPAQDSLNQQGNIRVIMPAQSSINSEMAFDLTPNWTASWRTSYDFTRSEFASHSVSLQRDLHDWRAIFAFTQAQNGNFSFNFFISLKAEPDLKFDYNRQSYRGRGALR
ncbi:MAG: putative LPS assembly protein LptD, partial [Gemmatimonadaceae bacterium]